MRPGFFCLSLFSFFLPEDGHTQKGLLVSVCTDRPLPSLQLVTHTHARTHQRCPTGAYRTLNKRGRIPDVFPHEATSCSGGRTGCWESTGESAEKDASSAEGLIGTVCVFHHSPSSSPSVSDFIIFISPSISRPSPIRSLFPLLSHPSRRDCGAGSETLV